MIKINLLKEPGKYGKDAPKFASFAGAFSEKINGKTLGGKLGVLLIPVVILVGYEQFALNQKQNEIQSHNRKLKSLTSEMEQLKPEINAIRNFREEKEKLQKKINTIKTLSSKRLQNVKAMDALQDIVPERAWLSKMSIKNDAVILSGAAIEDMVVSEFMSGLDQSIFFKNIRLLKSADSKTPEGVVKSFEIECILENI